MTYFQEIHQKSCGTSRPRDVTSRVTDKKFNSLPDSWVCPGCDKGKYEILDHINFKSRYKSISSVIHSHHNHIEDEVDGLLGRLFKDNEKALMAFSPWKPTLMCSRCNGHENSHMKRQVIPEKDIDLARFVSFSPSDIAKFHRIERNKGSDEAIGFAKKRYAAIRLDLLRVTSFLEDITTSLYWDRFEDICKKYASLVKTGLSEFKMSPRRDVQLSGLDIKKHLGYLAEPETRPSLSSLDKMISECIHFDEDLLFFMEVLEDNGVEMTPHIHTNGVLYGFSYIYDGQPYKSHVVTPTYYYMMGGLYSKEKHWTDVADFVANRSCEITIYKDQL